MYDVNKHTVPCCGIEAGRGTPFMINTTGGPALSFAGRDSDCCFVELHAPKSTGRQSITRKSDTKETCSKMFFTQLTFVLKEL